MAEPAQLSCPANYFGRGEDFDLPDDAEFLMVFNKQYEEWEREHPDDPTGEEALKKWKLERKSMAPSPSLRVPPTKRTEPAPPPDEESTDLDEDSDGDRLRLSLPDDYIKRLKDYARFKRVRPRDVVMGWIRQHAKI